MAIPIGGQAYPDKLWNSQTDLENWRKLQEAQRGASIADAMRRDIDRLRREVETLRRIMTLLLEHNPETKLAVDVLLGGLHDGVEQPEAAKRAA